MSHSISLETIHTGLNRFNADFVHVLVGYIFSNPFGCELCLLKFILFLKWVVTTMMLRNTITVKSIFAEEKSHSSMEMTCMTNF